QALQEGPHDRGLLLHRGVVALAVHRTSFLLTILTLPGRRCASLSFAAAAPAATAGPTPGIRRAGCRRAVLATIGLGFSAFAATSTLGAAPAPGPPLGFGARAGRHDPGPYSGLAPHPAEQAGTGLFDDFDLGVVLMDA